jgi:hypothetical protein
MLVIMTAAALAMIAPEGGNKEPIPFEPGVKRGVADTVKAPTMPAIATETGCLVRQLWDVQSIDGFTAMITIRDSAGGDFRFVFAPSRVETIDPAGTPLTTRDQAQRYEIILRTIEAAGIARRPLTITYEPANRRVFGIAVNWSDPACP